MSDVPCHERPPRYDHTPDHIPTLHGEKGYCKVCLKYDCVAETQAVDYGGVHLGLRWTPCISALEIEARKRLAEMLPAAPTAPQPAPSAPPATPASGDDLPITHEQAAVLKTLLRAGGMTMTAEMIVGKVSLSNRTVGKVLRSLRDLGLVEEPTPKKGRRLTAGGQRRTLELSADAGTHLFLPERKPDPPGR